MDLREERLKILKDVEQNVITIEEGEQKLAALDSVHYSIIDPPEWTTGADDEEGLAYTKEELRKLNHWKRFWVIPFVFGVLITLLGGVWMFNGYNNSGLGWGFWLSWIPLLFGLILATLSWYSRSMPWVHVRVRQAEDEWPKNIRISLPLPLGAASWVMRIVSSFLPEDVRELDIPHMISELSRNFKSQNEPLYVKVDDDDEDVEVFIG